MFNKLLLVPMMAIFAIAVAYAGECTNISNAIGGDNSFQQTCNDCHSKGEYVWANCQSNSGGHDSNKLFYPQCLRGVRNTQGLLRCNGDKTKLNSGSFKNNCSDYRYDELKQQITATCHGKRLRISLHYCSVGDLVYQNGNLVCKNADGTEAVGEVV